MMLTKTMSCCRPQVVCILALAVAACATGPAPDPREGGFIKGVSGLISGGYQARVDAREHTLQQTNAERAWLLQREEAVRRERETVAAQLQDSKARLADIEGDIARLRHTLTMERQATKAEDEKLRRAEALVAKTRDQLSVAAGGNITPARYDPEEAHEIALTLDQVTAIVRDLSGSAD